MEHSNIAAVEAFSNLHEVRDRLDQTTSKIRELTSQLRLKNDQLIDTPPAEPDTGLHSFGNGANVTRQALIPAVLGRLYSLELAVSSLADQVKTTTNI